MIIYYLVLALGMDWTIRVIIAVLLFYSWRNKLFLLNLNNILKWLLTVARIVLARIAPWMTTNRRSPWVESLAVLKYLIIYRVLATVMVYELISAWLTLVILAYFLSIQLCTQKDIEVLMAVLFKIHIGLKCQRNLKA